jgi:hypothetical protein
MPGKYYLLLLFTPTADLARRYSRDNRVRRDILCHNSAGRDHRTVSDSYTRQNRGARADPYVISNNHFGPLVTLYSNGYQHIVKPMIFGKDRDIWTQKAIVTDRYPTTPMEKIKRSNGGAVAENDAYSEVSHCPRGTNDCSAIDRH